MAEDAYVAIYNLSERGDCSREAYIEIALPIDETDVYNKLEEHCVIGYYKEVGQFVVNRDTISLLNNPKAKEDALYKTISKLAGKKLLIYYLYNKEYQGYSLEQLDRELQEKLRGSHKIFYLNGDSVYEKVHKKMNFQYFYFFDGKPVNMTSKEFVQKMRIDLPPKIRN